MYLDLFNEKPWEHALGYEGHAPGHEKHALGHKHEDKKV